MSASNSAPGSLFQGVRFWISREVPQRSMFKDLITKHSGQVTLMENDADVKLVDHTKKNIPAGWYGLHPQPYVAKRPANQISYSFKYIEQCVRQGRLVDLEAHRAGPSKPRGMGASNVPKKGTRSIYTLEDDQLLYDFLQPFENEPNAPIHGNKIYQLFERRFPKHTWQSSRSRYLKKLRGNPRPGGGVPRPDLLRSEPETERHSRVPPLSTTSEQTAPSLRTTMNPTQTEAASTTQEPISQVGSSLSRSEKQTNLKRKRGAAYEPPLAPETSPAKRMTVAPSHAIDDDLRASPLRGTQSISSSPGKRRHKIGSENRHDTPIQEPHREEVDMLFFELPFLPSTPEPVGEDSDTQIDSGNDETGDDNMIDWVERQVSLGFDDAVIDDALCCTSLNCKLAEKVLQVLAIGKPIPHDIPGVWTLKDDEDLEGQNAREIKRVIEKHGERFVSDRWNYLSEARDRGMV